MISRFALVTGLVVGGMSAVPVAPAAAVTDVCTVLGTMVTGPLYYPVTVDPTIPQITMHQPHTVGFGMAGGQCASSNLTFANFLAGGTMTGWCGHSSGQGMSGNAENFAWVAAGTALVFTGHVVGVVNAVPNTPAGESCQSGALGFLTQGAVVLLDCSLLLSTFVTVPVPARLLTPIFPVGVHTGPMTYHVAVCTPA